MARTISIEGKDVALPKGVTVDKGRIRIFFTYRGMPCYEYFKAPKLSGVNIKRAAGLLDSVRNDIAIGRFSYRQRFPNSKNVLKFEGDNHTFAFNITVHNAIDVYLHHITYVEPKAASTLSGYANKAKIIKSYFAHYVRVRDVDIIAISGFKTWGLTQAPNKNSVGLHPKTINECLVVLRWLLHKAREVGIIPEPLADRVASLPLPQESDSEKLERINPFTEIELNAIERLLQHQQGSESDILLMLFNVWVGLSVSELMALSWHDVDMDVKPVTVHIRRAFVKGGYKLPKEKGRVRVLELNANAAKYLKRIRKHSQLMPAEDVDVCQFDNVTFKRESLQFVFRNPRSAKPYHLLALSRAVSAICTLAGIPVRPPNNLRHSFASRFLTWYVPPLIIARQLGHTDDKMIRKHYGVFIPGEGDGIGRIFDRAINDFSAAAKT